MQNPRQEKWAGSYAKIRDNGPVKDVWGEVTILR
jgi:hypothetical protein